jgi:hypothetical protein
MPKCCKRRCVGTFTTKYKVYEKCCYEVMKVCSNCGCEFAYHEHHGCPRCGMMMDDPPRFGGFGRGFGRFGRGFGGFRRFGGFGFRRRFFPFGFGFFPEFEEEEEEEEF